MATKKAAGGNAKKAMSKNGLITAITETVGDDVSRKQVKAVLESLIGAPTRRRRARAGAVRAQ